MEITTLPSGNASISTVADMGLIHVFLLGFFLGHHTCNLKTGTPVATMPRAWRYRANAVTDQLDSIYCDGSDS